MPDLVCFYIVNINRTFSFCIFSLGSIYEYVSLWDEIVRQVQLIRIVPSIFPPGFINHSCFVMVVVIIRIDPVAEPG